MRPDGFAIADHDVGFLADDRVLDAVDAVGPYAVVAYLAVRDQSWARGERVAYSSAVRRLSNVYGIAELVQLQGELIAVGLLDAEGRIPADTWASWYTPANTRREARRESGRLGGLRARGKRSRSDAVALLQRSDSVATPDRPSVVATDVATDGRPGDTTATVYCTDYSAHRSEHHRAYAGGPFVCAVCGPAPAPAFAELIHANGGPDW